MFNLDASAYFRCVVFPWTGDINFNGNNPLTYPKTSTWTW